MNESDPIAVLKLASMAIGALADTSASSGEKAAALRTAAFAIEQAMGVQTQAQILANLIERSSKP